MAYLLTYAIPLGLGTLAWHINHNLGVPITIITTILMIATYTGRNRSTHKRNRLF